MTRLLRTAAVAATLAASALVAAPHAVAADTVTLQATVVSSNAHGETISITSDGQPFGALKVTQCGEDSATTFFCTGTTKGIINNAKVRVTWKCPVDKSCASRARGKITSHGSTLALLTVKATVATFQKKGATFTVKAQLVGERPGA